MRSRKAAPALLFASDDDRRFGDALARLVTCNPFLPERIDFERLALGSDFIPVDRVWSSRTPQQALSPNVMRINARVQTLVPRLRGAILDGAPVSREERQLYEEMVFYALFLRYNDEFYRLVLDGGSRVEVWPQFRKDVEHFLGIAGLPPIGEREIAHIFAALFHVRRAFHHIFTYLVGVSMPAARLRAAVWESIFTRDLRRYRRSLYDRMGDFTTLVLGPTGTGKELVARAIGLSRYVPFDPGKASFVDGSSFHPLNLSAMSPTLIESELFGHRKGAFTGALEDRAGWLEVCRPMGTVFLDEIGELDSGIQVKLLRVLQSRSFQRLGETKDRTFSGKIIAATHRDLEAEMASGRFRSDFYFRLCSDVIVTPSLREQIQDSEEELANFIRHVALRTVGEAEADALAEEVERFIATNLGPDYPWDGNVRELEQCVRNVLIRGDYPPPGRSRAPRDGELPESFAEGPVTAEDLVGRYCAQVYARTRSYVETARRLGLDRRTVKAKVAASRGQVAGAEGADEEP